MLRRIVSSRNIQADSNHPDEHMPPSPGDAPLSPDSSRPGGLASVFKGLTGAKLTKSPPPSLKSTSSILSPIADNVNATRTTLGLSPGHMESFELLRSGSGTVSERIAAANSLRYAVSEFPLNPVQDIWYAAKDMIEATKTDAERIAGWELLSECVKHKESSELDRKEYFQTLTAPANPEDFHLQLAAVVDLTKHGRFLDGFAYDVIPLLRRWLCEAYQAVKVARKQASRDAKKNSSKARAAVVGEEKNLHQLFVFISEVIKFGSNSADETAMSGLMKALVGICLSTTIEEDLRASISVINTIVTFGNLPAESFKECVLVLGSIYCLVPSLSKTAWHTISLLLKSHNGPAAVRVLVDLLRHLPPDGTSKGKDTRDIRGVLAVLEKLLTKSTEKGYPPVPFALLIEGLVAAVHSTDSGRVYCAILKLVNSLFRDADGKLHALIVEEDWSTLLDVAMECSKKASSNVVTGMGLIAPETEPDRPDEAIGLELLKLIARLEELASNKLGDFVPRQIVIKFFTNIHSRLPDSAARVVLTYFQEFRCCSPSDLQWEENLSLVLKEFYANRNRTSQTRLLALQAVTESYDMMDLIGEGLGDDIVPNLIKDLLSDIADETNLLVLEAVVSFMVSVAVSSDQELFSYITDTLRTIVVNERLLSPIPLSATSRPTTPVIAKAAAPQKSHTASGVVARGYVKLFMRCMNLDGAKSLKLFDTLVNIAKTSSCKTDARLVAMKLLFRLRADWANRVFLIQDTESEGLAATLQHTGSLRGRKQAEDVAQPARPARAEHGAVTRTTRGISFSSSGTQDRAYPIRSASGAKQSQPYKQLWALPDPEALPESPAAIASPILVSHVEDLGSVSTEDSGVSIVAAKQIALNMEAWLDTIVHIVENGADWEVYSMVLVHLPSQLTNHAIFRGAVPQVQELRRVVCEQIRTNNFQEPPNSTSLRRADVAICLFHSLTMILSYHEFFLKDQEDEIVQAFVKGISTWERCAKYCIHALSICCHELPLSTSKTLVQMLQKMAQIITQPHVAMHILEFLACLSRMQNLFVNFREEEYRIVFGICVRYLQYARDKKHTQRGSIHSEVATPTGSSAPEIIHPNAADDLPQYVYALAYHVITFWFLALKLPDRANHVGWIAKNLLTDVDGGQNSEEQALVTLDFMQRVAYADADESSEDLLFTKERFGEILKRRWLMGNSIVTIEQSTTTGWSQITKRQPSGTSSYIVHENFRPRPAHQAQYISDVSRDGQPTNNNILPSHIMVQLMTSTPQTADGARPIPLPDDDAVQRAVRVFDRNSTVDGHKVGVIYIGEGQTQEAEILSNVSGSSDYVAFLNGLGTLTKLKGSKFNTQGLDREYNTDGEYTFCWRDRVTEIVFHVITQMPTNLERDPHCINKKRHIGNDFVNIIFNDSGTPFRFDTFPSEFNYVNIVITPESRASFLAMRENPPSEKHPPFYKVQVMSKPGFPEISPASETKMVSLRALPGFIRLLALNASVFCLVWANREGGEHVSSWRNRLREIKRLREKFGPKNVPNNNHPSHPHLGHLNSASTPSPPPTSLGGAVVGPNPQGIDTKSAASMRDSFSSLRRSSVATFFTSTSEQTSHRSSMLSTTTNDTEIVPGNGLDSLVESVDFSKWA
ncbi:GTPase activating protein [Colletotrichum truncatum]|uniref:GTPase activating protein n=1 Tax=Colletotrichum truncatum TaxID=5467 RepID=A0ACC3ZHM4_COLTU|nr:GTPase activating protein [Colletotrichum truncatum]KAF6786635.1 GTPase activating protein [Colletotrichum truncatum]